jgi:hypothetical protein
LAVGLARRFQKAVPPTGRLVAVLSPRAVAAALPVPVNEVIAARLATAAEEAVTDISNLLAVDGRETPVVPQGAPVSMMFPLMSHVAQCPAVTDCPEKEATEV